MIQKEEILVTSHIHRKVISLMTLLACVVNYQPVWASTPDWKAQLFLGDERLKSQQYGAAEEHYRLAVSEVCHKVGSSADDQSLCLFSLAGIIQIEDRTEEVIPLYKKGLRILEKAHGKESIKLIPALTLLGSVYEAELDFVPALKSYERAVAIARASAGPNSLTYANCEYRLGRANFRAGYSRQAEELYGSALSVIMIQNRLPSNDCLENLLSDYIDLFRKMSDRSVIDSSNLEKELLHDRIGSVTERTTGVEASIWKREIALRSPTPPASIPAFDDQLSTAHEPGELPAQLPAIVPDRQPNDFVSLQQINQQRILFYERTIATDVDSLGPNHPSVARDLTGLAAAYLAEHKNSEAKPLLIRALKIYQSLYGSDTKVSKRTQTLLNLIDKVEDPVEDAHVAVQDYLLGLPKLPIEAQKLEVVLQLNYLALLCYSHGRIHDAAKIYAWALSGTSSACGETSLMVAACLTDYSRVLRDSDRQAQAERMTNDANVILRQALYKEALSGP